jgi:uncharacterized protein YyaL (SSP411 family)
MKQSGKANKLIHSSSPYLAQHAFNPVQWYPWGTEALQKAGSEDKPLIISIGYSACHWCHVMERESFENEEIAKVMNEGFVCIKVDREQRPDIDQIYMEAIQAMGISGGWPLNVFAMPDQRPFYGGTYFRPEQWLHVLKSIQKGFVQQRAQFEESAKNFAQALLVTDSEKYGLGMNGPEARSGVADLQAMADALKRQFDTKYGGLKRAPKFPNPSIWRFLLTTNSILDDEGIHEQLMLTLEKMANGGIYDHLGGGFARYSVDERWFAPHFEKMLYDNAQLISLYAMAYQLTGFDQYKHVVRDTIAFAERELMDSGHGFYAALDADSEGEEGNYYIWTEAEIDNLLYGFSTVFKQYYQVSGEGNWERGKNILHVQHSMEQFAKSKGLPLKDVVESIVHAKGILLKERSKRERPGLDHKILAGWNGLMVRALIDAYHSFGEERYCDLAVKCGEFIEQKFMREGALLRSSGEDIPGFLEDYALMVDGFFALHQGTFNGKWLALATQLADYCISNFYDAAEEMFYFSDRNSESLIARKKEIFDQVIPSSNAVMAHNLFWLGNLLERTDYLELSNQMLQRILPLLKKESQYLSHWGSLFAMNHTKIAHIAIVGERCRDFALQIQQRFIPAKLVAASADGGGLPILENRGAIDGKTTIYVCFNKVCQLPVHSVEEALKQLENQ